MGNALSKQEAGTRDAAHIADTASRGSDRKPTRPVTRPIFLHSIFARVEEFLHCYKTCAKQKPQPGVGYPAPRARHESRNTCEYTDVGSTHRASCDARVALRGSSVKTSPVGLGISDTRPRARPHTVHRARPDMRWPMLIWEQSLGHAWHGFAHAPLTWHRTPPPPDCRTH